MKTSTLAKIAPFAGSLAALKRLVETHLREREQAADMLKGYVTTITREVGLPYAGYYNVFINMLGSWFSPDTYFGLALVLS